MNTTDRLIIFGSILGVALLLGGATFLMPRINTVRGELQLTAHAEVMENLPPEIAFTQAALGSFRGLAVDVLWARATRMKQEGKHYEAMQLADWITKLQPRFPQVWQFHAWNMSYNISVTTQTPQERWMWVNAGVNLLREEGIPLNPRSVPLYKELGWIFLHKIGQYSDDMHWYYKQQVAAEWHEVLGPPPQGDAEEVLAWFRPVAEAYEAYVNRTQPGLAVREELEGLIDEGGDLAAELDVLRPMTLSQMDRRLNRLREDWAGDQTEWVEQTQRLRDLVGQQREASARDPIERLVEAEPGVAELLNTLAGWGLSPDRELLSRISRVRTAGDLRSMGFQRANGGTNDQLRAWLENESIAREREELLAFTRARVLREEYRMDPMWMLELMEGDWFVSEADRAALESEGNVLNVPIDWRHPAAHGLYWASMGVRRSQGLLRPDEFDVLNTDRQVLHALQALRNTGKLTFEPANGYYRQTVDPRFIDAYHYAVYGASDRIRSERLEQSAAPESFRSGHENFLIWAVQMFYFYGDREKGEEYYRMLRANYGAKQVREGRPDRYTRPLEEFVLHEFVTSGDIRSLDDARAAVNGMISQAIREGFINGRSEVAQRFLGQAEDIHEIYQRSKEGEFNINAPRGRMKMAEFDEMVADVFANYMLIPPGSGGDPILKSRAWRNAPDSLRTRVFPRIRQTLYNGSRQMGIDPEAAFPPPPGMEDMQQEQSSETEDTGDGNLLRSRPERN